MGPQIAQMARMLVGDVRAIRRPRFSLRLRHSAVNCASLDRRVAEAPRGRRGGVSVLLRTAFTLGRPDVRSRASDGKPQANRDPVGLLKKVIALAEAAISAGVFRPSDTRSARRRQVSKSALRVGIGPSRFGAFFNSPPRIQGQFTRYLRHQSRVGVEAPVGPCAVLPCHPAVVQHRPHLPIRRAVHRASNCHEVLPKALNTQPEFSKFASRDRRMQVKSQSAL
jgi:hypothetical protein